jgi:DNA-binding transcriptional ArsR family regulator
MADHLPLEPLLYQKGNLVIRALNHKLRQQMLNVMHKKERITVTELYVTLRLEQSITSQHLRS